ncbi:MAG TPA: phosphate acetyltransferase [Psychrobacter pasteurii]|uniref:Phosphate acetyltransferase n=1 Tax=Psychrobacter pasteurii TaxID=1945520 RepID=A0A1R4EF04_9GAMM|nr:phosphate acetyltransferase [Psychrobacter pasteurii]SJM37085.1 Phosphate acetyltransferase [Psychrobacter pasteurii]HJH08517.1 phosphate acetyltransferase [Psychrobacter pasteurii]
MQTILLVPTGRGIGLTSAGLGLLKALDYLGMKAGFMKPFLQDDSHDSQHTLDSSSDLIRHAFGLTPPPSIPRERVERMMNSGNVDDLMEEVVTNFHQLEEDYNVVICEGLVPTEEVSYASQVNFALATALDAKVIFVSMADIENPKQLADKLDVHARIFGGLNGERTLGSILMRAKNVPNTFDTQPVAPGEAILDLDSEFISAMQSHSPSFATEEYHLIGVVPFSNSLSVPRTWDIAQQLNATWLNEGEAKQRRVLKTSLTARTISRVGEIFTRGTLVVTPGDRDDLLLATAMASMNDIPMAGIVLTGGIIPNDTVFELCQPALKTGLPIMSVHTDSLETVTNLSTISNEIPKDDAERAETVARFVAAHIDLDWLKSYFERDYTPRLSPSAFRHQVVKKAQQAKKRVILPEGEEPRTIEAAAICQSRGIAQCVLIGNPNEIAQVAKNRGVDLPEDIEIIDPASISLDKYIKAFVERRKGKATEEQAAEQLQDSVVLGTTMLHMDEVDGLVSGAIHTTASTVRPAFQLIKTAPQYSLVSSIFFMLLPEQVVVYGDCAINPDPNAEQLAEIAIQSAASAKAFGIEPKVAMISYSTGASGTGDDVEKVKQATQIVRERAPDLMVDGPLQYDAASVLSVGKQKAPDSPVAGQANVFIFPDLNTGNTTYKAVQRSANVVSVGPMLQGLNKPVNDLSRGALVDDIVYTIALTAIQASSPDV